MSSGSERGAAMLTPKQVIIETSRACNLRCLGCPINSDSKAGRNAFMDLQFFKSVVDRIDFPTVVVPWLGGESLMHKDIAQMHRYLSAKGLPWYITTNGHFWNEEVFEHIASGESSCYQIIFSLDGLPGSKSISAARPGSKSELVVENIERFMKLWERYGKKVDMAVKIVERGQDWEEIENYVLYWLARGVSYVAVGKMLDEITEAPMRRYPCQYFNNNFMVIRHDGELVLCAYNEQVANGGENPLFVLDEKRPLLEAYNDARYQRYRDNQEAGIFDGPCARCGFAYTGKGYEGTVRFRSAPDIEMYHRAGYYNRFFSLVQKGKPPQYYSIGSTVNDAGGYYAKG